jgi:hypothetical protein
LKTLFALLTVLLALPVFAHEMPNVKLSPEFESMKPLLGTWEGTTKMNGKNEPAKVTYELTSGGTAIVEKLMPGTPHEMTTVYANRGNQVYVTHFCAIGNQPEMKLKSAKNGKFNFEMDGNNGISDKNEMHMHAISLAMNGNKLKQEWTNYNEGKKAETAIFEFTKKN